ncbi:histidine kinase dimerization/phospho-acceptor domain-containing protein [Orrella sp. 11846]|uniref:histidine kinase dimerization/phospho-acceptor domain-containing protein n=1 Tax=Orrella sp. 11846 TaxID=3409913 RepID=UPI003B5A5C37
MRLELVEQRLSDHKLKIEEQSRFMDMLSHELKTPLSVMQITLDTVDLPAIKRARLDRAANSMLDIIDRCRLSSQIEENRVRLPPSFLILRS